MTNHRIVIVGAGAAGLAVAEGLRDRHWTGEITLLGAETHPPYDRPPLSKQLLAGDREFDFVELASAQTCTARDIGLRLGTRAAGLDLQDKVISLSDGEEVPYDTLIIATGVEARQLPAAQGISGVTTLRDYQDALNLRGALVEGNHLLVVGAGFIGLEVAATAISKGCIVDVVEPAPSALMGKFPAELAQRIHDTHVDRGVRFHFGQVVDQWHVENGNVASVTLSEGQTLRADAALVGIGTIPAMSWLEDSGLELANGVVCDHVGRAADGVYAVGDVANWYHPRVGENRRIEHRLSAGEQAQVVASVLTGDAVPALDPPFFWTDQYDEKWQAYGYIRADAEVEVVLDDPEANRLVATLRRGDKLDAVIGKNAAKHLLPFRRELRDAHTQTIEQ